LSILLAMMFFVSHNVPENKPLPGGADDTKKVSSLCDGGGVLALPVFTEAVCSARVVLLGP
jgi:hypothetical protein